MACWALTINLAGLPLICRSIGSLLLNLAITAGFMGTGAAWGSGTRFNLNTIYIVKEVLSFHDLFSFLYLVAKSITMRKYFAAFFLSQLVVAFVSAQDVKKIEADFQNQLKDPKAVPYGHNAATGKYYDIRGFKMYCEIYGQGQPLLIIHGNGGSMRDFLYQIPYFSTKYKVILADS